MNTYLILSTIHPKTHVQRSWCLVLPLDGTIRQPLLLNFGMHLKEGILQTPAPMSLTNKRPQDFQLKESIINLIDKLSGLIDGI